MYIKVKLCMIRYGGTIVAKAPDWYQPPSSMEHYDGRSKRLLVVQLKIPFCNGYIPVGVRLWNSARGLYLMFQDALIPLMKKVMEQTRCIEALLPVEHLPEQVEEPEQKAAAKA